MGIKKWFSTAVVIGALASVALPLSNLFHAPNPAVTQRLSSIQDPEFRKVATLFENKCIDCHASHARMPVYANLPVVKELIQGDMKEGIAAWNLTNHLANNGQLFNALELGKLESVLKHNSMPPLKYVALHWNAMLTSGDVALLQNWIMHNREKINQSQGVEKSFLAEPVQPLPLKDAVEQSLDMTKVALGRQLFHDKRLSGDMTLSCASCHALHKGGTDRLKVSVGIRQQLGGINAPTVYNAVYNVRQFWDGRAATLEEQAAGPVANPVEMGATWEQVLVRLKGDRMLMAAFNNLYPDGITQNNVTNAIAEFERSLVTPNSRFDRYLRGEKTLLSQAERHGYQLFKSHCVQCHAGSALGGQSFEKMGLKADYFAARQQETGQALTVADQGVFNVSHQEVDRHKFKVPTLRNIAQTAPYFHDGTVTTLADAVKKMARFQAGQALTESEIQDLTAFLETLTGEYNGKPVE
jgi:cytochrome c peroxidase